ncbi:MAG: hypothetical protein ABWK05_07000 [Pyrobaculum sp.]
MRVGRESSLKVFRKRVYLRWGRHKLGNVSDREVEIFLKITKVKCDMCGAALDVHNLGYLRTGHGVELALCRQCLYSYAEYVFEKMKTVAASE